MTSSGRYPHCLKKISDLLNTEEYGFVEMSPVLIYEELKRAKLNTKERQESFVQRGGKRRLKPPGTPLLTLDGEVPVGPQRRSAGDRYAVGARTDKSICAQQRKN